MASSMLAVSDIIRAFVAQVVIILLLSVCSAFFVGWDGVWTVVLTGAAYVVPTALVAVFILLKDNPLRRRLGPYAVLVGECVKILMVLIAMILIVGYYENLRWLWFIITLVAVANSYFIVLFKRN